jgi:hypothetical protein
LLFDQEDVETQFRLSANSRLTSRDFTGLLKAIRARVQRLQQHAASFIAHTEASTGSELPRFVEERIICKFERMII